MKKIIPVVIVILVAGYFAYGFWLNTTLQASDTRPDGTFIINIAKIGTANSDRFSTCNQLLTVYPWQSAYFSKGSVSNTDCAVQDGSRAPFDFGYAKTFPSEKTIFNFAFHPFFIVNKLFFSKPLSVCLNGVTTPLPLESKPYLTAWNSGLRGFTYDIKLTDQSKAEWKSLLDGFTQKNSFPDTANLIAGSDCSSYNSNDILETYKVVHTTNYTL